SQQRRDEVELRLIDVARSLAASKERRQPLEKWVEREQRRVAALHETQLVSPVNGVVNRVFATPNEFAYQGRELLQIVNCDKPFVVALVSERVYRNLKLHDRAYVRLEGTHRVFEAQIIA